MIGPAGVLPCVDAQQGLLAVGQRQIGVAGPGELEDAGFKRRPGLVAAELVGTGGLELLREFLVDGNQC